MNEQTNTQMHGWTDGWTDGWMDGFLDGWISGRMHGGFVHAAQRAGPLISAGSAVHVSGWTSQCSAIKYVICSQ